MNAGTIIRTARAAAGLTLRGLAERAGTSHATLSAYEMGRVDPSLTTLQRVCRSAGFDLVLELTPRPRIGEPERRGEELDQMHAERFPVRRAGTLAYPRPPSR